MLQAMSLGRETWRFSSRRRTEWSTGPERPPSVGVLLLPGSLLQALAPSWIASLVLFREARRRLRFTFSAPTDDISNTPGLVARGSRGRLSHRAASQAWLCLHRGGVTQEALAEKADLHHNFIG